AQTVRTWTNGVTTSVFTATGNWLGGVAPATGDMARFNGSAAGAQATTYATAVGGANGILLDITSAQTSSLSINNTAVGAQTFRLGTGTSSIAAGAGAFTLGASGTANPVTLVLGAGTGTNSYTLQNNSSTAATIGQNVTAVRGGSQTQSNLILAGNGAWAVQGALGGSNTDVSLFVNGATVTLSGSNSHALGTTVSAGSLTLAGVGTLGGTSNALSVSGGLLDLGTTSQTVGVLALTGGTIANGTLTASSIAAQAGIVTGTLAGSGGLTKTTAGAVTLSGSNSRTGTIAVNEGSLVLAGTNRLPVASSLTLGTGTTSGTLVIGSASGRGSQTLAGLVSNGLGGSVVGGNASTAVLTLSFASGTVAYAGTLGGGGTNENALSLTKDNAGILALSGSNTFTGGVDFGRGTIQLGNDAALGGGTLTFVTNGNAKRLRSDGATSRTIANDVSLGSDARLGDASTGDLVFTGHWTGGALAKTITVDSAVELRGDITKTATSLTKDGAGTLRISGTAASFASSLVVSTGTANITGILGSGTAATVSVGGGAFLIGTGRVNGALTGDGRIAPGSSPGIFSADTLLATASTSLALELTGTGAPNWASATNSGNDVLRLTNATTPFAGSLLASNVIDVYFGADTGTFLGGFYTDKSGDFSTNIASATYNYYIPGDGNGPITYNGVKYYSLATGSVIVSTVTVSTAAFADGTVTNGQASQFVVVPEPASVSLGLAAAAIVSLSVTRRRR
ncbi:MAG: beta strand repeat-containing protein, partial [Pirellulales bacterium]